MRAGGWYLNYCFGMARHDYPDNSDRGNLERWARALEYYYAGPAWGRDPRPIVHVYRNGKRTQIHKARYSEGVLEYARALERTPPSAGA